MHGKFESSSRLVVSQGGKEFNGGNHNTEVPLLTSMEEEDLGFMYSCKCVGCRF
jgi:hypothetical protein